MILNSNLYGIPQKDLIMAAMVAGAVWGFIYYLYPQRLGALIVSHALWDVAVFIWFPI